MKNDQIHKPIHYLTGRSIEPIAVIEDWRLNHHQACVLKYIARAGRKDCEVSDLQKALWYLERYIAYASRTAIVSFETLPETYGPYDVSQDWGLGVDLSNALMAVFQMPLDPGVTQAKRAQSALQNRLHFLERTSS